MGASGGIGQVEQRLRVFSSALLLTRAMVATLPLT